MIKAAMARHTSFLRCILAAFLSCAAIVMFTDLVLFKITRDGQEVLKRLAEAEAVITILREESEITSRIILSLQEDSD